MRIAFSLKQLNETPAGTAITFSESVDVEPNGTSPDGQPLAALKYGDGKYASWNSGSGSWDPRAATVGPFERFVVPKSGQGVVSHVNPPGYGNDGQVHAWPCVPAGVSQ